MTLGIDGRSAYLDLSDEASAPDFRRSMFDEEAMAAADAYAAANGLPRFDAVADVDIALDLITESEKRALWGDR